MIRPRRPSRETALLAATAVLILALAGWAIGSGWAASITPGIDDSLNGAST